MKRVFLLLLLCAMTLGLGCGKKMPADFPKVHPISLTVTDGSNPLTDVRVTFYPLEKGKAYAASGNIDATTGAFKVVTTHGSFATEGIPAGEYVVAVEDIIEYDYGISPEEMAKKTVPELNELDKQRKKYMDSYHRKVPAVLKRQGKLENRSPIRFKVTDSKNELAIDVSKYK